MRVFVCGLTALFLSTAAAHAQSGPELPPGPNRNLVYGQCRTCHDLQYLKESAGIPRSAWADILDSMQQYGLRIPSEQRAAILDYLGTYLGPNPPPKSAGANTAESKSKQEASIDGKTLFSEQCSACHQADGQGLPGQFPPLAGNHDLFLSRTYPARVLLAGLEGKIEVDGKSFEAAMPSFAHLSDAEIAAVVGYVRQSWGNDSLRPKDMAALDAAAIAKIRKETPTPQGVHKRRTELKKTGR